MLHGIPPYTNCKCLSCLGTNNREDGDRCLWSNVGYDDPQRTGPHLHLGWRVWSLHRGEAGHHSGMSFLPSNNAHVDCNFIGENFVAVELYVQKV